MEKILITIPLLVLFIHPAIGALKCTKGLQKCQWETWSKWSSCSKDCGDGTRVRSRSLCCNEDDSFDKCLKDCGVADNSLETKPCGNVCPAGKVLYLHFHCNFFDEPIFPTQSIYSRTLNF